MCLLNMFLAEPTEKGRLALSCVILQAIPMEPGGATEPAEAGMTGKDNGRGTSLPPFPEILEALHRAAHS